jgi:hypothetical protein
MELNLDRVLALVGIILTVVLLALDKAEKLKGAAVFYLLILAAVLTVPLALSNPWVSQQVGTSLMVRRVFAIAFVIVKSRLSKFGQGFKWRFCSLAA